MFIRILYRGEQETRVRMDGVVTEGLDAHDFTEEQNNKTDKQIPSFRYSR